MFSRTERAIVQGFGLRAVSNNKIGFGFRWWELRNNTHRQAAQNSVELN